MQPEESSASAVVGTGRAAGGSAYPFPSFPLVLSPKSIASFAAPQQLYSNHAPAPGSYKPRIVYPQGECVLHFLPLRLLPAYLPPVNWQYPQLQTEEIHSRCRWNSQRKSPICRLKGKILPLPLPLIGFPKLTSSFQWPRTDLLQVRPTRAPSTS